MTPEEARAKRNAAYAAARDAFDAALDAAYDAALDPFYVALEAIHAEYERDMAALSAKEEGAR